MHTNVPTLILCSVLGGVYGIRPKNALNDLKEHALLWLGKLFKMVVHEYQGVFLNKAVQCFGFWTTDEFYSNVCERGFPGDFVRVEMKKKTSNNLQIRKS